MKTVVHDSSNPEQVKKAQKAEEDAKRDLEYILKEPRGRRWIYTFIHSTCHASQTSFVPGQPESTAYNEGARSIGEALLEEIRQNHFRMWAAMMAENHGDE